VVALDRRTLASSKAQNDPFTPFQIAIRSTSSSVISSPVHLGIHGRRPGRRPSGLVRSPLGLAWAVPIPKKNGGQRILGVPTVADRVAQTVVKLVIEPTLEDVFLPDSYGYRPNKSALDAVGVTRERCWRYDWILEFDIKGLFDNLPHDLLMKAVGKHVQEKWALLYIERWLKAPLELEGGTRIERTKGSPQGGVVSPILANLFMHYCFDAWMQREYPELPWCRYADDGLIHCRTLEEAEAVKAELGCFCRVGPGNFTPSPSQIPDLILSHHPARAIARRLPLKICCNAALKRC